MTREVSPAIVECELTHLDRTPIDLERARSQHCAYEHLLAELGCTIQHVEPAPQLPDSVFIEDTAIVLDELAIIARPGAPSRRREPEAVATALTRHRRLHFIRRPATLDGGDVLLVGRTLYVGRTPRTNDFGIKQLTEHVDAFGYTVRAAPVTGCLHLKSAITAVGESRLLINPEWTDPELFAAYQLIDVDPAEPFAANALWLGGTTVVFPAEFPRTRTRLEARGVDVHVVPADELAKAEGGVTCCSLVFAPAVIGRT
jgi:dimethylargininase